MEPINTIFSLFAMNQPKAQKKKNNTVASWRFITTNRQLQPSGFGQ
jgi:hypothetical protein